MALKSIQLQLVGAVPRGVTEIAGWYCCSWSELLVTVSFMVAPSPPRVIGACPGAVSRVAARGLAAFSSAFAAGAAEAGATAAGVVSAKAAAGASTVTPVAAISVAAASRRERRVSECASMIEVPQGLMTSSCSTVRPPRSRGYRSCDVEIFSGDSFTHHRSIVTAV